MVKTKIAISVDKPLLQFIESKIDGSVIRSRSQAIEFFLRKGVLDSSVSTAVILLRGEHQKLSLQKTDSNKTLLDSQIEFFAKYGVKTAFIVTQYSTTITLLLQEISDFKIKVEIINANAKGNADALEAVEGKIKENFITLSGDTYNNFDLAKMIKKHDELDKIATMGLMTREKPSSYGTAILDGDLIIDFKEKPKHYSTNIVNAGIYIFKPEVFEMLKSVHSLEKDLFPRLAKIKQLAGFFTYGEYEHFGG